jgi:acetoin utilization deacetylase AcuC-like enzyme
MRRTGFLFDERFLLHDTGPDHSEAPGRLEAAFSGIQEDGILDHPHLFRAQSVDPIWVERVHSRGHIQRLEKACRPFWREDTPWSDFPNWSATMSEYCWASDE